MNLIQQPVTGHETENQNDPATAALVQFYRAFNGADLDLMAQNWLAGDEAAMSNPLGGIKRGWAEIRSVYERIFTGPAEVYVEFYGYTIFHGEMFFQAIGRERGRFVTATEAIDLDIRTSRIYVRNEGKFRQLHHHGSIEQPELLARYQKAVQGKKE